MWNGYYFGLGLAFYAPSICVVSIIKEAFKGGKSKGIGGEGWVGPERREEEEKPDNRFANNKKSLPESSNLQTNLITKGDTNTYSDYKTARFGTHIDTRDKRMMERDKRRDT